MYVNAYGKAAGVVAVTGALPLDSVEASQDAFVVKYDTTGKSVWSARITTTTQDLGLGITTDTSGNIYVSGQGGGTGIEMIAYNSDGSFGLRNLSIGGNIDAFLVKYNSSGVVQWMTRITSTGADLAYAVATDASGNIFVTGQGGSGAVVTARNSDGTSFGTTLTNAGTNDVFIAKYNTNGFVQWITRVASTGVDSGFSIATDASGNVLVTGQSGSGTAITAYTATTDAAFFRTFANAGSNDTFVVKYNTNGVVQWIASIASTGADIGYGITTDSSNNIYVTGQGGSGVAVTVYNSSGTAFVPTIPNAGGTDAFIVKYNSTGFVQWVARVASTASDIGYGIKTDSNNNVYVIGQGGAGAVVTAYDLSNNAFGTTLANAGSSDVFIAKYNTSGIVQWVARIATNALDIGYSITTDSSNNVYVTGQVPANFLGITAYNANGTTFGTLASGLAGNEEVFLAKYDTNGTVQWFTKMTSAGTDTGRSITVDSTGNAYTTGQYNGLRFTLYGQALSLFSSVPSAGGTDAFVVKYTSSGAPQWVGRVASTGGDVGYGITSDTIGNVYTTGQGGTGAVVTAYNADTTAFGTTISNAGGTDVFAVKYNTSGAVQWIARVAGTGNDVGYAVSTDSSGNLYIGGQAGNSMVAYNANGTAFSPTIPNAGSTDMFVTKYDTSGTVQWSTIVASGGIDQGFAIASDTSGNSYITGRAGGTITAYNFDNSAFPTTVPDTPLVKYNTSGTVQWVAYVTSPGNDYAYGLDTDLSGNVYMIGQCAAPLSVYNADGTVGGTLSTGSGFTDIFVAKYNTNGFVQWVARLASTSTDIGYAIATDPSGNVYVGGQNNNTLTGFNADGTAFGRTVTGGGGFVVKYNTNGVVQWMTFTSGIIRGIAADSSGNVYAVAQFGSVAGNIVFTSSTGEVFASVFGSASLVKYDTNGIGQWVQVVRGSSAVVTTRSVTVDPLGNPYITGETATGETAFIYNLDLTPYKVLNSLGSSDVFIAKYSPTAIPQWVARISSSEGDIGYGIVTDISGNLLVCGRAGDNTVTFYNANGSTFGTTLPRTAAGTTGYVAKYDMNGSVQWIARLTTGTNAYQIATDASGNAFVVGNNATTAYNSDGTAFSPTLANAGGTDAFIVKYNSSGFVQWLARVASPGTDNAYGVATDASGNMIVTGQGGSSQVITAYSAGGSAFSPSLTNSGSNDAFIVKYNTDGIVQWITKIASTGLESGFAVTTGPGRDVYVTGQGGAASVTVFSSDGNAFATPVGNAGAGDAFVVKYNETGIVQWVTRIGGGQQDIGYAITTDSGGNIFVSGTYGNATATSYSVGDIAFVPTLASSGASDVFVVKYNSSGVVQWNARISTFATDITYDIVTDSAGSVYISGSSSAYVTAYNADGILFGSAGHPVTPSGTGSFIVKYSSTGVVQWISTSTGNGTDSGRGIALDSSNNIYLTGEFSASTFIASDA